MALFSSIISRQCLVCSSTNRISSALATVAFCNVPAGMKGNMLICRLCWAGLYVTQSVMTSQKDVQGCQVLTVQPFISDNLSKCSEGADIPVPCQREGWEPREKRLLFHFFQPMFCTGNVRKLRENITLTKMSHKVLQISSTKIEIR